MVGFLARGAEDGGDGEGIAEEGADAGRNVGFVTVEEGVEVDGGEVGADAFKTVGGVVPGFADGAVVQEEGVEGGFVDAAVIVGGPELFEGHVMFLGVGVEDVGELGRLTLGGDTAACGTVSGEAGFGVESGFGHPPVVVFFHGGEDGLS